MPCCAAVLQEIPDDQKIFLVTNGADDVQVPARPVAALTGAVRDNAAAILPKPAGEETRAACEPSGGINAGNCGLPKGISKLHRSAISIECASQSGCSLQAAAISAGVRK